MAYKVKYNGYEVECETAEDLRTLLNLNVDKPPLTTDKRGNGRVDQGETTTVVSGLVAKLKDEQRDLLRAIAAKGIVTRQELRQAVGVSDPHEFAGLLIGITKSAAGSGIESPIKKLTERVNGRGPRIYKYKIRDDIKAEVKAALTQ